MEWYTEKKEREMERCLQDLGRRGFEGEERFGDVRGRGRREAVEGSRQLEREGGIGRNIRQGEERSRDVRGRRRREEVEGSRQMEREGGIRRNIRQLSTSRHKIQDVTIIHTYNITSKI